MDKQFLINQTILAIGCLIFVPLLFEVTNIDMWLQSNLYQTSTGQWLLDKHDKNLQLFFYDGPKKLLTLLASLMLLVLIVFGRNNCLEQYRQGLAIVLISTLVTVALVGALKTLTNVPCPKDLTYFGGDSPYITLLHRITFTEHLDRARCFPAGHASGGFALLSLFFLFRRRRNQWIGFAAGMSLGWIFGVYKMLIGDHFLSHTLVTMCLSWLVSVLVAGCVYRISAYKNRAKNLPPFGNK